MTTSRLPQSLTTIIHGTNARHQLWWQPGQPFTTEVAKVVNDFYPASDFFSWSGGNSDADRRRAATQLIAWRNAHLAAEGKLWLICHSHGGNVAILATQMGLKIDRLILLATPIRTDYAPRIRNVNVLVNLYVPWDSVQTAGAVGRMRGEGRTLADGTVMINRAARGPVTGGVLGLTRSHSDIHDWSVWVHQENQFDKFLLDPL